MQDLPIIKTDRITLRLLAPQQAALMVQFRVENRAHLKPWEPMRPAEFFTRGFWELQLHHAIQEFREGRSACFVILDLDETEVIGVCNYTNIIKGGFLACYLGYSLDASHQGKGIMLEALRHTNDYVFLNFGLHRIMANYMPSNRRSARVLEKLGFTVEGFARAYLQIDGRWEDHVLTSLINPAITAT